MGAFASAEHGAAHSGSNSMYSPSASAEQATGAGSAPAVCGVSRKQDRTVPRRSVPMSRPGQGAGCRKDPGHSERQNFQALTSLQAAALMARCSGKACRQNMCPGGRHLEAGEAAVAKPEGPGQLQSMCAGAPALRDHRGSRSASKEVLKQRAQLHRVCKRDWCRGSSTGAMPGGAQPKRHSRHAQRPCDQRVPHRFGRRPGRRSWS